MKGSGRTVREADRSRQASSHRTVLVSGFQALSDLLLLLSASYWGLPALSCVLTAQHVVHTTQPMLKSGTWGRQMHFSCSGRVGGTRTSVAATCFSEQKLAVGF